MFIVFRKTLWLSHVDWWGWQYILHEVYLGCFLFSWRIFFLTFLFTKFEDMNLLVKIPKLDTSVVIIWTSFCAETKSLLLSSISVFFILNAFESFIVTQLWSFTFLNNVASEFTPLPTFVITEMLYLKHLKRNSLEDRVHFQWSTNKY